MTTPKFTSGPWHYGITSECIINARGEEIADLSGSFITEKEDNARLIASAPALYAALYAALEELERVESSPRSETVRFLAREQARAVLSLARGEKGETK